MTAGPSFQAYLDALKTLGLPPDATIADARRAYKKLMRQCHPDLWPGDVTKAQSAQALNAAKDLLERISRDGLLADFALQAENQRRTFVSDTLIVWLVIAPAGAGKTLAWVRATARAMIRHAAVLVPETPRHVIYSAPTILLLTQTAQALAALGLAEPVVTVLHGNMVEKGVAPAIRKFFATTPATRDTVLLCSHAAIFDTPPPPDPGNWDLVFDEMPDTTVFLPIDAPDTHRYLTNCVTATPLVDGKLYRLTVLNGNDETAMRRLARIARNHPYDAGLEHLRDLARALVHAHTILVLADQWDELTSLRVPDKRSQFAGHLDVLTIVPPTWFQRYRSVTVMGARCLSHLTTLVWQRIWHVDFRETDRFNLPRKHSARQTARLTIRWLFEERTTRSFLARKATSGGTMFLATCQAVARFHAGKPFLWSAPQPGDGRQHGVRDDFWQRRGAQLPAFDPMLRLPGRTHGLNDPRFLHTYDVALLSVTNFTPAQFEMLHALTLTNAEIDKALSFDVAYQDACRSGIRRIQDSCEVRITVIDEPTALDLAAAFEGCRVDRYPDDLIPRVRTRKRGRPAATGAAQSATERSRAYRVRLAALRARQGDVKRES